MPIFRAQRLQLAQNVCVKLANQKGADSHGVVTGVAND